MPDGNPLAGLYPQPPQQGALSANPLAAAQAVTALQKSRQELAAQTVGGEIYRRALQPDGSVDMNSVVQGYAQNPTAAYALPQQTTDILAQRGQNIANAKSQFELGAGQNTFIANTIGAMADNPKLTKEDVLNNVVAMSRNSNIPSGILTGWANSLPDDSRGLRQQMQTLRNIASGAPATAARIPGPPGPGGEPTSITQGTANYIPSMPTGTPMGAGESAGVMQSDLARAGTYSQDIYPLQRALDLAKSLGPGGMAPGSKGRQEFESFVYGLAPQLVPQGMQDKIKNYAELEKYLVNNASQRANSMGPHTNEGLAQATTGSPNVSINDLAGVDLIKAQLGLRRMEQAQIIQAAKQGPVNYTAAKSGFSSKQDPRAYQINDMSPDQISDLQKNLKGPERARFNASLKAAIDSGVVHPPGQ